MRRKTYGLQAKPSRWSRLDYTGEEQHARFRLFDGVGLFKQQTRKIWELTEANELLGEELTHLGVDDSIDLPPEHENLKALCYLIASIEAKRSAVALGADSAAALMLGQEVSQ